MKKPSLIFLAVLLIVAVYSSANAYILYETNFDDGNLADWTNPIEPGPWTVQDGALTADLRTVGGIIQLTGITLPDSFMLEFDIRTLLLQEDVSANTSYFAIYTHFFYNLNLDLLLGHGYRQNRIYIDGYYFFEDFTKNPSEWHHMKFVEDGVQHSLYFDGQLVYDLSIPDHPTGGSFAINLGGVLAINQ